MILLHCKVTNNFCRMTFFKKPNEKNYLQDGFASLQNDK